MRSTSRAGAYVEAATMGAVAAFGVVGLVVAFGGVTLNTPGAAVVEAAAAEVLTAVPRKTLSPVAPPARNGVTTVAAEPALPAVPAVWVAAGADDTSFLDHLASAVEMAARADPETDAQEPRRLPQPAPLSPALPAVAEGAPSEVAAPPPAAVEAASIETAGDAAAAGALTPDPGPASIPFPAERPTAFAAREQPAPASEAAAPAELPPVAVAARPAPATGAAPAQPDDADLRIVAGAGANVRSGPGMAHETLFALAGGTEVTLSGENDHGWRHVTDAQGRDGWIYGDYLQAP